MVGLSILPPNTLDRGPVAYDSTTGRASVRSASGRLLIRLNLTHGVELEELTLAGRNLIDDSRGIWTGLKVGNQWATSRETVERPQVTATADRLTISGIEFGSAGLRAKETWTFVPLNSSIRWTIDRRYLSAGTLDDTAQPNVSFSVRDAWAGAMLGTGGVAWGKLIDSPNATYGVHTNAATFWKPTNDTCLRFVNEAPQCALRFTREADGRLTMDSEATNRPVRPKYKLSRFHRDRQDVWASFPVVAGESVHASTEISVFPFAQAYGRGSFKGLDTAALTQLIDTIGRIGVIDDGYVGSNGWYSGYICMHEPWIARVGTAIDDPNYLRSCERWLDFAREHAIAPDGMVKSRWDYDEGDAQPGTYDPATGFYEAQWGRLMDSQSSYVTNVADLFEQTGDRKWLSRQRTACESALDYLLRRDSDGDHLVEMANDSFRQRRSSDWLDIVWASHENAFVNAQLYGALMKWADDERLLGFTVQAARYREDAAALKKSFNRPIADGGFWDPDKGWYVYWREADGATHGNNLVVPVNLTALAEGICDEPARRKSLLGTMESRMKAENLLSWPSCFEGYAPGEGADDAFPKYENGDVFLAWAEYGIRAYAPTRPEIALEYVRRIVDQYKRDGLAFQRYLRASGKGAGDDILANNCNVATGLYRDIFGIQPRHDRLVLDPHLTSELSGTHVRYRWRGKTLAIDLATNAYRVSQGSASLGSKMAFGVDFQSNGLRYFASDPEALALTLSGSPAMKVDVDAWRSQKRWRVEAGGQQTALTQTFSDLPHGRSFLVLSGAKRVGVVREGRNSVRCLCRPRQRMNFRLVPQR